MIIFKNHCLDEPFVKFKSEYERAVSANQKIVEAISISSFCKTKNIVDTRYVNLKIVNNRDLIFFSNYNSPKAQQFESHNQIAATIYWNSINVQIRMRALISRTSEKFNKEYFSSRSSNKNALAISSMQSEKTGSYQCVQDKYLDTLNNKNLKDCPDYWGGFVFQPYYFEFWEGHESRINKRQAYEYADKKWKKYYLQP